VDILVEDSGHLRLLDGADTALRVQDKDGDILLAPQAVDGRRASITTGGTDNGKVMSVCEWHVSYMCMKSVRPSAFGRLWSFPPSCIVRMLRR
jgi:hypothetical protein